MARRAAVLLSVLILLGSLLAAGGGAEKSKPPKDDYYELYKVLVDTIDQVERNYVEDIDRRELVDAAIAGILEKLDPYSRYISGQDEVTRFRSSVESEFGGIGIQLAVPHPGRLMVLSPLVGTPAYRAGLLAGDRIVEIDGESTEGFRIDDAIRRLKGKERTDVKLTVIHPGETKRVEVAITRERIHVDTVLGHHRRADDSWDFVLDPKHHIGYMRATAFSRDTADEIRRAMKQLQADGMRALILDLRLNPGGLLSSAIEVSDLFVSEGVIVSTKGRNTREQVWHAEKQGTFEGFPMVVLVNRYSASASEIVSACLQDHGRAVVVGERTWGKGSVQNVIELESGSSALKLTTASFFRPNGKNIHRFRKAGRDDEWGVTPDDGFRLRLGTEEMLALIEDRRQRDIVRPHRDGPAETDVAVADDVAQPPAEDASEDSTEKTAESSHDDPPSPHDAENGTGDAQQQEPKSDGEADAAADKAAEVGDANKDHDPKAAESAANQAEGQPEEIPDESPVVDRQLQKAVEYIIGELTRAAG